MPRCVRASQRVVVYVLGALLLLVVGAKRVQAQAVSGNISGTVTDASGGVIAGANIQVKNTGTGVTQTTTSNSQGRYNVPDLTVGTYDVQASNSGFQTVVHAGINLTVGSQLTVDLSLPVGQAQQTVTVETSVAQVETQSTAISSLISPQQLVDLPLNGRNFEQLLNLMPSMFFDGSTDNSHSGAAISSAHFTTSRLPESVSPELVLTFWHRTR